MADFEGPQGRQSGRVTLAVGGEGNLLTWHDPPGTPPSSWALVVLDPLGGSIVNWTTGHDQITLETVFAPAPMVAGRNVFGIGATPGPYGSSVTVNIISATASTFNAILVRVNV